MVAHVREVALEDPASVVILKSSLEICAVSVIDETATLQLGSHLDLVHGSGFVVGVSCCFRLVRSSAADNLSVLLGPLNRYPEVYEDSLTCLLFFVVSVAWVFLAVAGCCIRRASWLLLTVAAIVLPSVFGYRLLASLT